VTAEGPRRISDREAVVVITGYFVPADASSVPVLVGTPGTDDLFVFAFSTEEKLASALASIRIGYERVVRVIDGAELLGEIAAVNQGGGRSYRIRVAVDPHKGDNGRVCFVELERKSGS